MPRRSFHCACARFTPIMVHNAGTKGKGKQRLLPYLDPARVPLATELQLKQESDEMVARLGSFVARLIHSLKSRSISPATVSKFLLKIDAFPPTEEDHTPFLQHRSQELRGVVSVDNLILTVTDYVSFFNHDLVEHLVRELGSEGDRDELETLLVYCEVFSKRSIFQVPSYVFGYLRLRTETLVVMRTDDKWAPRNRCSVKELSCLLRKICDVVNVLPHVLHFCRADFEPGGRFGGGRSLEVVCRMPPHVVEEVFPLSKEEEKELGSLGVAHLHTTNYCFPPPKKDPKQPAESEPQTQQEANVRKTSTRISGNRRTEEMLWRRLRPCCQYHQQMGRLRSQSCALVTGGDTGYEGDSDSSSEESAPLEPIPAIALRPSHQKRLMWRLANSHF